MRARKVHTVENLKERCIEEGDCWLWQGYSTNGVPMVSHEGKMVAVRALLVDLLGIRVRWAKYFAPKCECLDCVNPDHVGQFTQAQHMSRMGRKTDANGPGRRMKLTKHARATKAKLTIEIAREIRLSDESGPVLAAKYGVDKGVISRIRRNESWQDLQNPFWRLVA